MWREVRRPRLLRPPVLCLRSVRPRSGRLPERRLGAVERREAAGGREGAKGFERHGGRWLGRGSRLQIEFDLVAGLEGHDGLLEVGGHARRPLAAPLVLAEVILDVDAADGDLEGLLDRRGDGVLGRAAERPRRCTGRARRTACWPFPSGGRVLSTWSAFISSFLR